MSKLDTRIASLVKEALANQSPFRNIENTILGLQKDLDTTAELVLAIIERLSDQEPATATAKSWGGRRRHGYKRSKAELLASGHTKINILNARVISIGEIRRDDLTTDMTIYNLGQRFTLTAPLKFRKHIKPGHHVSFTAIIDGNRLIYKENFQHQEALTR